MMRTSSSSRDTLDSVESRSSEPSRVLVSPHLLQDQEAPLWWIDLERWPGPDLGITRLSVSYDLITSLGSESAYMEYVAKELGAKFLDEVRCWRDDDNRCIVWELDYG